MSKPKQKAGGDGQNKASSIYVGLRLRPWVEREKGQRLCITMPPDKPGTVRAEDPKGNLLDFGFDCTMDSSVDPSDERYGSQEMCYNLMGRRMLDHMVGGFNTTLFAYGQTGTGKTTTVMGETSDPEQWGILPRMVSELFDKMEELGIRSECRLTVRMLEIYNEKVQDLLSTTAPQDRDTKKAKLEVHVHPKLGVYVQGLTVQAVESPEEILQLIEYGNTMKTVHSTAMNAKSSRSHTLFGIMYEKTCKDEVDTATSMCYVVDLAGRENEKTTQVKGQRFVELSFINKSLFYLANCIHALGSVKPAKGGTVAASQARFRNSKLTLLLAESLDGNSKTGMVGTLSPAMISYEENASTLRLAATVKNIKVVAKSNAVNKKNLVEELQEEIAKLKADLLTRDGGLTETKEEELKNRLTIAQSFREQYEMSWDKAREQAETAAKARKTTLGRLGVVQMALADKLSRALRRSNRVPLPYMTNESEDPALSGKLIYSFAPLTNTNTRSVTIGSAVGCDILLRGLGIAPILARVDNSPDGLQITGVAHKISVNGETLAPGAVCELMDNDQLILGRAFLFRVITTQDSARPEGKATERDVIHTAAPRDVGDKTIAAVLPQEMRKDDNVLKLACQYISHLENIQLDMRPAVTQFLSNARNAQKYVDEANEITHAIRPNEKVNFELCSTAPVAMYGFLPGLLPNLSVRLVREVPRSEGSPRLRRQSVQRGGSVMMHGGVDESQAISDNCEVLYIWTFEKFFNRLEQMRDVYLASDGEPFQGQRHEDPWLEVNPSEMEIWAKEEVERTSLSYDYQVSELDDQLRAKDEEIRTLKDTLLNLESSLHGSQSLRRATSLQSSQDDSEASKKIPLSRERMEDKAKEASEQLKKCMELCASNQSLLKKFVKGRQRSTVRSRSERVTHVSRTVESSQTVTFPEELP